MNEPTKQKRTGKAGYRGFYAALGVSLMMIAAACFFAYRQTSNTLEDNLSSLTEQMEAASTTAHTEAPAVGVQTDVLKETTTAISEAALETTAIQPEESAAATGASSEEMTSHQIVLPLDVCQVLQPFSNGELVKSETTGTWQTHNGVDLACDTGTDVFAIDTGTVADICSDPLWGYTITIDHGNGVVSKYCGMDGAVEVRMGDVVQSGQKIGVTGTVPDMESELEPHLHLEVQKSGVYIDPEAYYCGE